MTELNLMMIALPINNVERADGTQGGTTSQRGFSMFL